MNPNLAIIQKLNLKITHMPNEKGEMTCFCPLHQDKSPSLGINVYTGKFLCRAGCIKGNSIRDLVFKITGETIVEGNEGNWAESFKRRLSFKKINDIYNLPSIPILPLAWSNLGGEYLRSRKLNEGSVKTWGLQYWEKQRAVVIPISGIGYILRYIEGEKRYKYLPGTRISETLFGMERFKTNNNSAILVEGAFDTIWMHQLDFKNTLGILKSDVSEKQIEILGGICNQVYLMFDMDRNNSGQKAQKKAAEILRQSFIVKTCQLPINNDPNSCSEEQIKESINNAVRV